MYESALLAERLKAYAKIKKVTLKSVFEECGLGRNTMAHLTDGKSIAHDSLALIADYLDCSVDYLLGVTDDPAPVTPHAPVLRLPAAFPREALPELLDYAAYLIYRNQRR